ncbi:MAG: ABC transporter ATP-binding protein [Rhodospirillales bacterium]|nr:ABC transporter ATP-binding protein [Rhodospirillales bacterium]
MTRPLLEVQNLTKSFGALRAARDLSLVLHQGGQTAIIGPNGAGKSTLFNLLTGYHAPDAGRIIFDGASIAGQPPHKIARAGISRAFQIANIFGRLTVYENVRSAVQVRQGLTFSLFGDAARLGTSRAEELLGLCGLEKERDHPAGQLSQGDKKKLELALALAGEPKLLLLDEPTAGMSLEETRETMTLVDRLNRDLGVTILFTEHDMSVVFNHARRVMLLHHGEFIVEGTPEEIRANPSAQKIYLGEHA